MIEMDNKTKIAGALIVIIIIAAVAYALLSSPATAPVTTVPTTTVSTTTVAPVAPALPGTPNETTLRSVFAANGSYNSSTRMIVGPLNGESATFNSTTIQFNFSRYGPIHFSETISYPTTNSTGYTAASTYPNAVNSTSRTASISGTATNTTGTVSGMTYTLFQQNATAGKINFYLVGYSGIASVSAQLTTTATSPVNSTTLGSLISAIAKAS